VGGEAARAGAANEPPVKKMGWIKMAREGYGELVNAIIRPPRAQYSVSEGELGPTELMLGELPVVRTDLTLQSQRVVAGKRKKGEAPESFNIVCSHWEPKAVCRPAPAIPCVVYLHGNCGCRIEALDVSACLRSRDPRDVGWGGLS
jgi:hypothetical protein